MPPRYLDFKLTLAGTPDHYTVAAQGPRGITIDPLPTQLDLHAVREAVLQVQDGQALEPAALERLGAALFDVLFPRKIARAFERAYEDLEAGTELRLKLSLLPPEFGDLPWELLYDPDVGAFLAARATMPIVRVIESGTPSASLLARRPLRVIQVQASPKDVASLDLAGSEAAIRAGLAGAGEVTVLRSATPAALQAALRQGQFHVLHIDDHGYFDAEANTGYLLLEDADGEMKSISADLLASYLDGTSVRLVVLAACQTAAQSQAKRFSGLAQYLMRTVPRLPAVVAMQFDIPDQTAIAFFGEFYRALADGFPVDAAVVEGRKAILAATGERPDWATPVLFLRQEDGDILREEGAAASDDQPVAHISAGGDVVMRDKTIEGDEVRGSKIEGDQVNIETLILQVSERLARDLRAPGSPPDLAAATEEHLRCLVDRHQYLSLKGMGVSDRVPLRLSLLDLYVPLKARLELPEGETWRRLKLAGRALQPEDAELMAGRLGEPQPVLELLQRHDGLVILGDPGAGKTTFLKYLALQLALGNAEAVGLGNRLPVLVPLSAYANALRESDVRLDDFIATYMHDLGSDLPMADLLQQVLSKGAGLLLLDGLDEVVDPGLRNTVVERVVDFYTFHRRAGNKFVLTSRIVGYRAVRPTAPNLAECTLVDFEDEEIGDFVGRWTQALEAQASGAGSALAAADALRERAELLEAVQRNPGARRLAANPLLLTILALMKRQGVTLPERRVELYDQYVRTLLSTWNRARGLAGRVPERDLDPVQTMKVLAPLALWMHEVNPGVGLVKREALRRQLEAIFQARGVEQAEDAAKGFLEDVREHAGLLVERGAGEYGFIHLTFEEYLAGAGIALLGQRTEEPIVEAIARRVGDPAWSEVSLLAIGHLGVVQQREEAAGAVVEALAKEQPGPPGEAVVLAGEAVQDAGAGGVPAASRERVVAALVESMQASGVPAMLRRRAGLALGRLAWLPNDLDEFVEVPAGEFLYGDRKKRTRIPYTYWIARYPVTNAQFARFMADGGYARRKLWSEEGWSWRVGGYDSKADDRWKDMLARRPVENRDHPFWWDEAERANPIFPVVGVNWFEAEAYANWLNSRLDALQVAGQGTVSRPTGYVVCLAGVVEWERAARGVDGREYPWGDAYSAEFANTEESDPRTEKHPVRGIGTTAVCTYPQGVSPVGAWDTSGNVWEWTRSPVVKRQPRMVVRGGACYSERTFVRCAYQERGGPDLDLFFDHIGLRVVLSLADSEF